MNIYPELSMIRWMDEGRRLDAGKCLFATTDDRHTYADVYGWSVSFARYLADELGLARGSAIVLSASNNVQVLVVLAAAQLLDVRVALFSTTTGRREFERGMELVRPRLVISSDAAQLDEIHQADPDVHVMLLREGDARIQSVDDVMRREMDDEGDFPDVNADAEIVVFTSGSTGAPKAIVNRASSFALNGKALRKWLELTGDDVLYLPVPLIHVFGLVGTHAALAAGASIVTSPKYDAREACSLIESRRVTVHLGVPTNFIRELRENEDGAWDFGSLRAGLVAGADCPPYVIEEFERRYGCRIMQSYGMSETAATLTVTPLEYGVEERVSTVGFCIDGAEAKADAKTGEIMCKTPSMMVGILQPDGTTVLELDDGWLRTGDVGRIDGQGLISITGRLKNAIVRGGINIFPSEIESVYDKNDDVVECCTFAVADEELGQRICAAIVLRDGSGETSESLRSYAMGRIDKCKIPDYVLVLDKLPYLGNGKVDRVALEETARTALLPG